MPNPRELKKNKTSSTNQRRIVHVKHNNTLMLRTILTPPPNMRLDNIPTVHERHLSILLDPDLIPRMRRNHIQRSDVDAKLPRLGVLANTDPEGEEVRARDRSRQIGYRQTKIVDSTPVKTENIAVVGRGIVGAGDQGVEGTSGVVGQLGEQSLRLFFR